MKYSDTLHLILKDKWFQLFKEGVKTEEYNLVCIPYGKYENKNMPIRQFFHRE